MNGTLIVIPLLLAALAGGSAAAAPSEKLVPVPFIGCASDGQVGPRPVPKHIQSTPKLEPSTAQALAFYAGQDLGVLAPRGWHCFELYGSSGSTLIVTAEPYGQDLFEWKNKIKADAIELTLTFGGTSGRFEVADVGARFFSATRPLVNRVRAEGITPVKPVELTEADHVLSQSASRVEFSTAVGKAGLGTRGRLGPSSNPIVGAFVLVPDEDFDLVNLNVRLPESQRQLTNAILHEAEAHRGDPSHAPSTGDDNTAHR